MVTFYLLRRSDAGMKPSVVHPLSGVRNHIKDKVDGLVSPLTGVVFTPALIQTVGAFCFETGV